MWMALLVGVVGVFALNQRPFQDVRPTDSLTPVYRHTPSEDQDVEARLWEDPLGAVATAKAADNRKPPAAAIQKAAAIDRPPANPPAGNAPLDHTTKRLRNLLEVN